MEIQKLLKIMVKASRGGHQARKARLVRSPWKDENPERIKIFSQFHVPKNSFPGGFPDSINSQKGFTNLLYPLSTVPAKGNLSNIRFDNLSENIIYNTASNCPGIFTPENSIRITMRNYLLKDT